MGQSNCVIIPGLRAQEVVVRNQGELQTAIGRLVMGQRIKQLTEDSAVTVNNNCIPR